MQVWNVLHAARWKYRMQKWCQKSPSAHHRTTLSSYIFATKACINNWRKNLLNGNISSICLYNMVNFSPATARICWRVWGTPANFNGFRILASLLQRRRSLQANQALHDVWLSPGLVYYIYIFWGSCPLTEFFPAAKFTFVLHSPILAALVFGTGVMRVSQTLRPWAEGATYIRQGGHHVAHWPTF